MGKAVKGAMVETKLSPIIGIFLTVFIDLLGFGVFIPDLQLRGRELGAEGLQLGLALGVFSLAQLVTAPLLGRISDVRGRRTVLVITCLLSFLSYVAYAHATNIWFVILSRVLSGVAGANIGVAFAYIADVTTPENRAKGMGTVGAAFGLGFVLGPGLGAFLLKLGHNSPLILGYVAAGLSLINFLYVLLFLPESAQHQTEAGGHYLENFAKAFRTPGLPLMLVMFFAVNFGFTNLETTFFQLLADQRWIHHLGSGDVPWYKNARDVGAVILTLVGIISVIMQGFLVRMLTPKFGEVKLLRFAYLGIVPVLALIPFAGLWAPMIVAIIAMGVCMGLSQPSLSALISRAAPRDMQGGIFGVTQSLGAFARFVGPLISNPLFEVKPFYPYLLGAAICTVPALLSLRLRQPSNGGESPQPA